LELEYIWYWNIFGTGIYLELEYIWNWNIFGTGIYLELAVDDVVGSGRNCTLRGLMICKIKAKVPRNRPADAEGGRGKALLFLDLGARRSECQHHAPAALPPGKTRYPLYRRLSGPQGRFGRVRKISPHWYSIPGQSSP
jgi:hypothetical protein